MENTLDSFNKNASPLQELPDVLKIVFFILLMMICGTVFSTISMVGLGLYYQIPLSPITELASELGAFRNAEIALQIASAIGAFVVPALIYAHFFESKPKVFLKTKNKLTVRIVLFTIVIFFLANYVLYLLTELNQLIPFENMKSPLIKKLLEIEDLTESTFKRFLDFSSPLHFIAVFIMMAVLPAVGEELTFRGVFFNLFHRSSKNLVFAILFSGFIFALIHFQLNNFLAIFFMGGLLAYIYHLTENIWVSIIAHLFNNGLIVVLSYLSTLGLIDYDFSKADDKPLIVSIFGTLIFLIAFYFYRKVVLEEKQKHYE